MENLLDIDYLRSTGCQPKWFGLGFIQLKLDDTRRMHFWHPSLVPDDPAFDNEYHDHRYDFTSRVLIGHLTTTLAGVEADLEGDHEAFEVCCAGGGMDFIQRVRLIQMARYTTPQGMEYSLQRNTLHKVSTSPMCVTLQTRSPPQKDKARVVKRIGTDSANPFSDGGNIDHLWECIADTLPPRPGYHMQEIEKGVLGQPCKIREEVNELIDAFEQGSRVMQLVELSDMMGAIEAFLERHHAGYTLDDLQKFSSITKRAFLNGYRG